MWLFMNDSNVSIVEHKQNIGVLVVRSRIREDLLSLFGEQYPIHESVDSDYRFRVFVPRVVVADIVSQRILDIEYSNFKNSIPKHDKTRSKWYNNVWFEGMKVQEDIYGPSWVNYHDVGYWDAVFADI